MLCVVRLTWPDVDIPFCEATPFVETAPWSLVAWGEVVVLLDIEEPRELTLDPNDELELEDIDDGGDDGAVGCEKVDAASSIPPMKASPESNELGTR